ncbi:hypothetical protein HQN60_01245 [Deefgea piscis]|uniref:Uncharacterized protein n=1 Tax=Deefgea piscis TaxID=2739061 RepID=A0A6M8SRI3_9NEIS|nr:hypothetical protein [Deefgea piscis]QKJ65469.1 hypothetical protein HQN60_01245 [Deefgea piscis]
MSSTIEDRMILILKEEGEPHGYWSALEKKTGISSQRWRKTVNRLQRPTTDMLEVIAKLYPKYAFWLVTGTTDALNGHIAPINSLMFPERLYAEQDSANAYFRLSIELAELLAKTGEVEIEDDKKRMSAYERALVFTQYHGSWLVDVAYEIAKSNKYEELKEILSKREVERSLVLANYLNNSKEGKANNTKKDAMLVRDSRTAHQSVNELFWRSSELE